MKLFHLYFMMIICYATTCYSQDPYYVNYTIDDGLPSNEVYDVELDHKGVLWFTTDRGVCSYDGYQFTTYTTHNGLGDNVNFEIFKSSDNTLWFFGYNGKITLYEDGDFTPYIFNDQLRSIIDTLGGNYIKEIREGSNKKLYLTCNDQKIFEIITLDKYSQPKIYDAHYQDNIYYIDSFCFYENMNKITGRRTSISITKNQLPFLKSLDPTFNINFLYEDESNFWYTSNSSNLLQKTSKNQSTYKVTDNLLTVYESTAITKDKNNGYWISTRNKGILYIANIDVLTLNSKLKNIDNKNYLRFHSFSDYLLCGTSSSSIIRIDTLHHSIEYLIDNTTRNNDINQFQTVQNGKVLRLLNQDIEFNGDAVAIQSISKRKKETLVTSTLDTISSTKNDIRINLLNKKNHLLIKTHDKPICFIEDLKNNIWIGTLSGVLIMENFDYQNPQNVLTSNGESFGRINDITIDVLNNIWISTIGNGIFIINSDEVIHFNTKDGLSTNIVNTIEVIDSNEIWVATNKGLNLLSYSNSLTDLKFIEAFDQADGLNSSYINDVIKWNEKIYVASPNGICYFPSQKITKPRTQTPLNINSVSVNDLEVNVDSLNILNYDQNKIDIKFTAIRHNKSSDQSLYKYKLTKNGEPSDWNYINDREVIFENLDHGKYVFEVNAQNKFNVWNSSSEKITFSICPHFSDTLWFNALLIICSLIAMLLVGFYFLNRYNIIKENELALEEAKTQAKVAEIAAIRNQMNPHFIFNSLNSIQNLIFKKDVLGANHYLSKFSTLIRKSLEYSRMDYITIESELMFIKNYIELEQLRFPSSFDIIYNIDTTLNIHIDKIPSLIVQPIIENSIKHAFKNKKNIGLITLNMRPLGSEYIEIVIEDNGEGIQTANTKKKIKHNSLGLTLISDRILILKKSYPDSNFSFNNIDQTTGQGLRSTLILPLQ